MVTHGNYGMKFNIVEFRKKTSFFVFKEAYSVARQFNLIPPICEQAEYHLFQRDKVEVHLPEIYHKIGMKKIFDRIEISNFYFRYWNNDLVSISMRPIDWKI